MRSKTLHCASRIHTCPSPQPSPRWRGEEAVIEPTHVPTSSRSPGPHLHRRWRRLRDAGDVRAVPGRLAGDVRVARRGPGDRCARWADGAPRAHQDSSAAFRRRAARSHHRLHHLCLHSRAGAGAGGISAGDARSDPGGRDPDVVAVSFLRYAKQDRRQLLRRVPRDLERRRAVSVRVRGAALAGDGRS